MFQQCSIAHKVVRVTRYGRQIYAYQRCARRNNFYEAAFYIFYSYKGRFFNKKYLISLLQFVLELLTVMDSSVDGFTNSFLTWMKNSLQFHPGMRKCLTTRWRSNRTLISMYWSKMSIDNYEDAISHPWYYP